MIGKLLHWFYCLSLGEAALLGSLAALLLPPVFCIPERKRDA